MDIERTIESGALSEEGISTPAELDAALLKTALADLRYPLRDHLGALERKIDTLTGLVSALVVAAIDISPESLAGLAKLAKVPEDIAVSLTKSQCDRGGV